MKIFDERGVTLYELLAVLVISMIILPVIYGVFSSGLKLYNKIQVEGQLRDDADYTVTMIMNEFYAFPFDYVESCGDNCIELVDSTHTSIDKVKNQTFYTVDQKKQYDDEIRIEIKLEEIDQNGDKIKIFFIGDKPIDVISDFSDSQLTLGCPDSDSCESGIINLDFHLDNKRLKKPLELSSQFGF